jgi:hypothetical protein
MASRSAASVPDCPGHARSRSSRRLTGVPARSASESEAQSGERKRAGHPREARGRPRREATRPFPASDAAGRLDVELAQ